MRHTSYFNEYKALQRKEIQELEKCLKKCGGAYDWNDDEHEDECRPIICVGLDYYVGDVNVNRVYFDDKGNIKVDADEHDGWADMTFDIHDVQFGDIDYIMSYMTEFLTEQEKHLICQAATDLESGNYLLRKRTDEELQMISEVSSVLKTPENERDEWQKLVYDEYMRCVDPDYQPKTEQL